MQHAADGIHRLELKSLLREELAPSISLKHVVQPIRPCDHRIGPLGSRDVLFGDRPVYEMVNTYNLRLVSVVLILSMLVCFSCHKLRLSYESRLNLIVSDVNLMVQWQKCNFEVLV